MIVRYSKQSSGLSDQSTVDLQDSSPLSVAEKTIEMSTQPFNCGY